MLEDELKTSYSKAGASHVLAVSGLHVGIIFLVLNYLFGLFIKGNLLVPRLCRATLTICLLWGYAFLTGSSPSVMRASLMFSFLQLGFLFQRPYYVYSSIVASAFILLLYNPRLLFDVGFQLSYTAVISILFFQPRFSNFGALSTVKACNYIPVKFRKVASRFMTWSVDLSVVSLSAQLGTLPLVLYYFHQFSCLFWLSGLFVIPLATILIYLGVSALAFSCVPYISTLLVGALSLVASATNRIVEFIGGLPCAVVDRVDFRAEDVVLCYCALFLFAFYLVCRRYIHLLLALVCACALLSLSLWRCSYAPATSIAVYNYPGRSAVNLYGKDFNTLYATADSSFIVRQLNKYWIRQHTASANFTSSRFLKGGGVTAFVVDKDLGGLKDAETPICIDNLIISSDVRVPMKKINNVFRFKRIIVDSSCSLSTSYWWKKQCPSAYLVRVEGDYIQHVR